MVVSQCNLSVLHPKPWLGCGVQKLGEHLLIPLSQGGQRQVADLGKSVYGKLANVGQFFDDY